jgi:biopolymer transport protein ExbB/TolQ
MHQLPIAVSVEDVLFDVAEALRVPVLVLALIAGVIVLVEVGALLMELLRRRRRGIPRVEKALDQARAALAAGDRDGAIRAVRSLGYNRAMSNALAATIEQGGLADAGDRIAKRMAEYDYHSMRRLERTRILVRAGPALGLMGTLIPLSPALKALAEGNVNSLTEELRVAFSVTVAGLLVGLVAFAVSLIRDRLYAQDFSDVEYVAAALDGSVPKSDGKAPPAVAAGVSVPQPTAQTQVVTPSAAAPQGIPSPQPTGGGSATPETPPSREGT